jgi:hypothetical protein
MLPNSNVHLKAPSPGVKISLGHNGNGNGDGSGLDAISGRGLAHRKWTVAERIAYAADVATGAKQLNLSQGQLCQVFHITPAALRAELKARNGNGAAAVPEWAKVRLRTIVDDLGLTTTVELLSEIETEMQCKVLDVE